ncbi:neuromedin-S isoform X2 [Anguilla anguilla]|uniref:neuromedin-S isoform X2 n=1 Tax=Anguilla anguilla TaxID=7936 RepID=UPI0015A85F12|nr:neuromedin-S isoform X2 [Anguilla anguilla]
MGITLSQLFLICFVLSFAGWPAITVSGLPYRLAGCSDKVPFRKVFGSQKILCGLTWEDHSKDQIQDVYKRFLFHYSKSQDSHHSVNSESQSAHPLLRLSPKLRRKKQFILMPSILSDEQ